MNPESNTDNAGTYAGENANGSCNENVNYDDISVNSWTATQDGADEQDGNCSDSTGMDEDDAALRTNAPPLSFVTNTNEGKIQNDSL